MGDIWDWPWPQIAMVCWIITHTIVLISRVEKMKTHAAKVGAMCGTAIFPFWFVGLLYWGGFFL